METLSRREIRRFIIIYGSFVAGLLLLLLAYGLSLQMERRVAEQAALQPSLPHPVRFLEMPSLTTQTIAGIETVAQRSERPVLVPEQSYNTGYNLATDSFSFRNYGSRFPEGNLTVQEVYDLFGDQVCAVVEDGTCVPMPQTQFWVDQMNGAMNGGHCVGFTVLSRRVFSQQITPAQLAAGATVLFDVSQDAAVMRQIAQNWVLQMTDEVINATVDGTPREIIDALLALQEPVDLGIFGRSGGGHSVLAYAVRAMSDGIFHILVYDNNWPGREMYVEVDYRANTWRYSLAAQEPSQDPDAWEGDARTHTLIFVPFTAYDQAVSCPFCEAITGSAGDAGVIRERGIPAAQVSRAYNIVSFSGTTGRVQVEDEQGRRLGRYGDAFVNEIPGARLIRMRSALFNNSEPILAVPPDVSFQVRMQARPGQPASKGNLRIIGPRVAVALDSLQIQSGEQDALSVHPQARQINYQAGGNRTPVIKLSVQNEGETSFFTVGGASLADNQGLQVGLDPRSGQLELEGHGLPAQNLTLVSAKITQGEKIIFANNNLNMQPGASLALDMADWQGGAVEVSIAAADGNTSVQMLEDKPLAAALSGQKSSAEVIAVLGDMAPYMDENEAGLLVDRLAETDLDGGGLGEVLYAMNGLTLDNEELVSVVAKKDLPPDELAEFVSELNLDAGATEALVQDLATGLALSDQEIGQLEQALAEKEQLDQALADWEFGNEDPTALAAYLQGLDLSADQTGEFIDELDLFPSQVASTLDQLDIPLDQLGNTLTELHLYPDQVVEVLDAMNIDSSGAAVATVLGNMPVSQNEAEAVLQGLGMTSGEQSTTMSVLFGSANQPTPTATATSASDPAVGLVPSSTRALSPLPSSTST
ncbi:MAG: hypothetical protein D6791_16290, partial [Chloroflexi bacterium]